MNLLKTSQLCCIEVFENVLNDVVVVSAVKHFIQDTLGFVELPSIYKKCFIGYVDILENIKLIGTP